MLNYGVKKTIKNVKPARKNFRKYFYRKGIPNK